MVCQKKKKERERDRKVTIHTVDDEADLGRLANTVERPATDHVTLADR